jgi:hypothetical protein
MKLSTFTRVGTFPPPRARMFMAALISLCIAWPWRQRTKPLGFLTTSHPWRAHFFDVLSSGISKAAIPWFSSVTANLCSSSR